MKKGGKEMLQITKSIKRCEECLLQPKEKTAIECGIKLIQQVKNPILILIENHLRSDEVKKICEVLIEVLIRCGNLSYKDRPLETVQLSAILNYCCFIQEEFNLSKEVSDYLNGIYNEWYSLGES
jgi:hypothetical protein